MADWLKAQRPYADYRLALAAGVLGLLRGLLVHGVNYQLFPVTLPGYPVIAAPGIFLLGFFSEELDYRPKLQLFLLGQFMGYFVFAYAVRKSQKGWIGHQKP